MAPDARAPIVPGPLRELRVSCEAKQCMTEHGKTEPRIFDELSSSHEIVLQGDTRAIAAGVVVVNIAPRYASPTRQTTRRGPLVFTSHRQPEVTANMVGHLRGLKMRDDPGEVGFDAFATIVIDSTTSGRAFTQVARPATGRPHHYATSIERISRAYAALGSRRMRRTGPEHSLASAVDPLLGQTVVVGVDLISDTVPSAFAAGSSTGARGWVRTVSPVNANMRMSR